jgi:hypothetical protein
MSAIDFNGLDTAVLWPDRLVSYCAMTDGPDDHDTQTAAQQAQAMGPPLLKLEEMDIEMPNFVPPAQVNIPHLPAGRKALLKYLEQMQAVLTQSAVENNAISPLTTWCRDPGNGGRQTTPYLEIMRSSQTACPDVHIRRVTRVFTPLMLTSREHVRSATLGGRISAA